MQRNFAAFLVLSFGILVGWMFLVNWLRPVGFLKVAPEEGVKIENVSVIATGGPKETKTELVLAKSLQTALPPGDYDLALKGEALNLKLSDSRVTIRKSDSTSITLAKVEPPKNANNKPDVPKPAGDAPKAPTAEATPKTNDKPAVPPVAAKAVERQHISLGSVHPDSPYRMLVTFDNAGAAVERIELGSERYHDMDDLSGYLGNLALEDAAKTAGAVVHIVGHGTPANLAGIEPGDTITKLNGEEVANSADLASRLAGTKPWQEVTVEFQRAGKTLQTKATLGHHPLQMVRPEVENRRLRKISPEPAERGATDPLSFLMTLDRVDKVQVEQVDQELPGVDLRTANWEISGQGADFVEFAHTVEKHGLRVYKRYTLAKPADDEVADADARAYHLTLKVTIEQIGDESRRVAYRLDGPTGLPTEGWWYSRTGMRDYYVGLHSEKGVIHNPTACIEIAKRPQENAGIRNDAADVDYIGVNAQYFTSALIPKQDAPASTRPVLEGDVIPAHENLSNISTRLITAATTLNKKGDKLSHEYEIFAGPKRPALLEKYGLDRTVDYGFWGWAWIARMLQSILHFFYRVVGNYGIAIVMLTVLVRLCMFPLSRKQVLGAMKMQELQPEMKRISEQYKKDMEGRNKAMNALFRKHNYRPLAGCLPMFIQFPIFIGLYNSLWIDIELRQASLIPGLHWCSNLAAPDMLADWSRWMPDFVMQGGLFHLLPPAMGPYFNILPLFTISLMLVQQKLFTPPPTSEQAEMQQKVMKYMMFVLCLMFYKVASGLCLYFICSSLWGLAERKIMPKPAAAPAGSITGGTVVASRPVSNGSAKAKKRQNKR